MALLCLLLSGGGSGLFSWTGSAESISSEWQITSRQTPDNSFWALPAGEHFPTLRQEDRGSAPEWLGTLWTDQYYPPRPTFTDLQPRSPLFRGRSRDRVATRARAPPFCL